ncbi:cytochrome c oxidase cbb3-type subunit 3 [Litoreibacter ponti]|uniref:Cbb3-type cytochrome c oxidase subunit n=1 Tax=Litoreibacter ponti TaxID=1510457 RepID=A0A2T6BLE0_9RHOB|nr:cytochrome-c oxidase, cbb3-type subunit III [Litoreibacter ponti]PTX56871.1 cytochrome c oxidase cbb3-type subunit 3 [Litoreibacter ponti]
MTERKVDDATGVETTGHTWDGIEELNNPLPRWWLWTFYITIVWGVLYTIAFPAWPLISQATGGVLGYSTRGEVAERIEAHEAANAGLVQELNAVELASLAPGDDLHRYAVGRGASVFRAQCSQCHGQGAAGFEGYPNLLDDDWLWGGDLANIQATIQHGIRNETDPDARFSQMPAYGEIFEPEEIDAVVEYVLAFSREPENPDLLPLGEELYLDNCAACHGDAGMGDREQGAPNLTDAIWLYGSDREDVEYSVINARYGVMPAWGQRLSEADVRAVSVYVHSLGGGEVAPSE